MFNRSDTEIKIAFMQAMTERSELGHEQLGPDHILLGLLTNVRGSAFKVLTRHGITYDDARAIVADRHQDDDDEATDAPVDTSSNLDEDREALRAIGIDLDKVRAAVRETFGQDLADGWGERRGPSGRGRGRERGRGPRATGEWDRGEGDDRGRGERGDRDRRRGPRGDGGHGRHGGPHHDHHRGDRDDHRRGGPHRRGDSEDRESFGPGAGFGPFGEFFGGPRGRGSRGPQSRRFGGFGDVTPSLRQVQRELFGSLRAQAVSASEEGRRPSDLTAGQLLAAVVDVDDPVVQAVLATAGDPSAARRDIAELAGLEHPAV